MKVITKRMLARWTSKRKFRTRWGNAVDYSIDDVERILDDFMRQVNEAMVNGDRIVLANFGAFYISHRKAFTGRNPLTNLPIEVPAKRVIKFKPCKRMKERVNAV